MRHALATLLGALACAAGLAAATPSTPAPDLTLGSPAPAPTPYHPPVMFDGDRDGLLNVFDCNDDDPAVYPGAAEIANGIDDDCNGVVDDGFDTTFDAISAAPARLLFPRIGVRRTQQLIPIEAQPRLVWAGSYFVAVWSDAADRIRLMRIREDGTVIDEVVPRLAGPARNPDVAWTGTRLAIAFEDTLTPEPSLRLVTLDPDGTALTDSVVAAVGREPKIAWGQDRFGIVWRTPYSAGDGLRFQTFDRYGLPLTEEAVLPNSGSHASIAFTGTGVMPSAHGYDVHEGAFVVAYEPHYAAVANGDVLLTKFPREPWGGSAVTVRVNQDNDPVSPLGALPAVAANTSAVAVAWHVLETEGDRASVRIFSHDDLTPVQEFMPDSDAGRSGRMVWTGAEFVMANDNICGFDPPRYDVHVRRIDASGNTHLASGWGPHAELNLGSADPGIVSVHPDIAVNGRVAGVIWIMESASVPGVGHLYFTTIQHR